MEDRKILWIGIAFIVGVFLINSMSSGVTGQHHGVRGDRLCVERESSIQVTSGTNDVVYTDRCDSEFKVLHYYCKADNTKGFSTYRCGEGMVCSGGRCIPDSPPYY